MNVNQITIFGQDASSRLNTELSPKKNKKSNPTTSLNNPTANLKDLNQKNTSSHLSKKNIKQLQKQEKTSSSTPDQNQQTKKRQNIIADENEGFISSKKQKHFESDQQHINNNSGQSFCNPWQRIGELMLTSPSSPIKIMTGVPVQEMQMGSRTLPHWQKHLFESKESDESSIEEEMVVETKRASSQENPVIPALILENSKDVGSIDFSTFEEFNEKLLFINKPLNPSNKKNHNFTVIFFPENYVSSIISFYQDGTINNDTLIEYFSVKDSAGNTILDLDKEWEKIFTDLKKLKLDVLSKILEIKGNQGKIPLHYEHVRKDIIPYFLKDEKQHLIVPLFKIQDENGKEAIPNLHSFSDLLICQILSPNFLNLQYFISPFNQLLSQSIRFYVSEDNAPCAVSLFKSKLINEEQLINVISVKNGVTVLDGSSDWNKAWPHLKNLDLDLLVKILSIKGKKGRIPLHYTHVKKDVFNHFIENKSFFKLLPFFKVLDDNGCVVVDSLNDDVYAQISWFLSNDSLTIDLHHPEYASCIFKLLKLEIINKKHLIKLMSVTDKNGYSLWEVNSIAEDVKKHFFSDI